MTSWLLIIISISIFVLTFLCGRYVYRYLNNKLMSGNSWWGIAGYAILLFAALAVIYCIGLLLIALIYQYIGG